VKLMGALGAWLGAMLTVYVFVASSVIVGVVGIATMLVQTLRRGFGHVHRRYLQPSQATTAIRRRAKRHERKSGQQKRRGVLPYAVPLALATWMVLAWKVVLTQI
jgi:Flp pilus assembly protein protease CpaA